MNSIENTEQQAILIEKYAKCIRICIGTNVCPWECVKYRGNFVSSMMPYFDGDFDEYNFAIAIAENKPVFVGDVLYDMAYKNIGENCARVIIEDDIHIIKNNRFSWNPPKPTTFEFNGKTLPLPTKTGTWKVMMESDCGWTTYADMRTVTESIYEYIDSLVDE